MDFPGVFLRSGVLPCVQASRCREQTRNFVCYKTRRYLLLSY